jgi:hypothetical protein
MIVQYARAAVDVSVLNYARKAFDFSGSDSLRNALRWTRFGFGGVISRRAMPIDCLQYYNIKWLSYDIITAFIKH